MTDQAHSKPTVLAIDDTPENLTLIHGLLKEDYRVKVANGGERGLALAQTLPLPDLILLDVMMPGMDGWEVCRRLKSNPVTRDIPVIFLTAKVDAEDERQGFALGAVDYIIKPINPPVLLARVSTQVTLKASADFLRDQNSYLEREVAKRTRQIAHIQEASAVALASLAEIRDNETGNHIRRTRHYVQLLADYLRPHPRFTATLTDSYIAELLQAAPLHDIGKVGIPDRILLKPGKLDPDEFAVMKTHTTLGKEAVEMAERQMGIDLDFLRIIKEIAYCHHERWDGRGYPQALAGDAIPVSARLMALADVYDALTSVRVYKPAMSHETAREIIEKERAQHFDPDIVDAFLALQGEFQAIAARFADTVPPVEEAAVPT